MLELSWLVRSRSLGRDRRGRLLREQAGISLRELAAAIGVDVGTLSRWERGQSRPRPVAGEHWARACQLIEDELNRLDADSVGGPDAT